jgi:hypothetical protein
LSFCICYYLFIDVEDSFFFFQDEKGLSVLIRLLCFSGFLFRS